MGADTGLQVVERVLFIVDKAGTKKQQQRWNLQECGHKGQNKNTSNGRKLPTGREQKITKLARRRRQSVALGSGNEIF